MCLLQHSDELTAAQAEVRPRVERRMTTAVVTGHVSITAEDDGGICLMQRTNLGWQMSHPYWALLEAKRAFSHVVFDDNKGAYYPQSQTGTLPQYLGEAIITWKGNQALLPHGYAHTHNKLDALPTGVRLADASQCLSRCSHKHVCAIQYILI